MAPRRSNNNPNRFAELDPSMAVVQAPFEDTSSPYYLHNNENPGTVLVTTPLSGSNNYHSWSRAMLTALDAKNKAGFVDGSISRPTNDDLLFAAWKRCNSMVKSWLFNAICKEITTSLLCFQTAAEIWTDLKSRFMQSDGPRVFEIKKSLAMLQQGALDINTYYTKMKVLWDELEGYDEIPECTCPALQTWTTRQQKEAVLQFLMGLNDSYSSIRGQILLMEPLPSLSKVFSLVIQEERQRKISTGVSTIDSSSVGDINSLTNAAFTASKFRSNKPFCTHCNRVGHTIDKCYKIHGFPAGLKAKSSSYCRDSQSKGHSHTPPSATGHNSLERSLTNAQWQQLVTLLNSQSQHSKPATQDSTALASLSSFSGSYSGGDDWDGYKAC
ncbi:hypothetical protein PTKIN_Ptkin15bG0068300 [Pterospermum kingtungense]